MLHKIIKAMIMVLTLSVIGLIVHGCTKDKSEKDDILSYNEDFEHESINDAAREIGREWTLELASSWGTKSNIVEEEGNKFLRLSWIEGRLLKSKRVFASETTFSGRFRVDQSGAAGGFLFARTTIAPFVAVLPDGTRQTINEYENDGYNDGTYAYGVGATGVYIKLQGTLLQINVRTEENDYKTFTKGLGRKYIEVEIPNGKDSLKEFVSVKIEDRDNTLKIYAEDVFLASVEYSDSVDGIFRKAVLKDAEGKVIYDIDNARIADKDATFAIAARGAAIDVDDIEIESVSARRPGDISLEEPKVQKYPDEEEYLDGNRLWQGIPGIERAPSGRLWATWYSGSTTEDEYNWVVLYTSSDDGTTWKGPAVVIDPVYPVRAFDPMLWSDPDGRLWLFWSQSYYYFDGRAGVWAIYTENPDSENPTWSKPVRIGNGIAMNKPIVLSDGTWMLPTAVWRHGADLSMYEEAGSNVYVSTDKGKTWSFRGGVKGIQGSSSADENMVVELGDGSLMMYIRTTIGIEKSYSYDKGYTWSDAVNANITKTVSRFFLSKLDSGKLLLVYHNPPAKDGSRSYLTASISEDDGKTWKGNLIIDERNGVSYPDGFQTKDGKIYVIYDRNRGSDMEILMAVITEEDILAGRIVNPESRLKVLVNNNGKQPPKTPEELKNTGITPTDGGQVAVLENNKTIFSNRSESRVFVNLPKKFHGMYYVYSELEYSSARIDKDGDVYIFTKRNNGVVSLHGHLTSLGFVQDKSVEPFRMFDQATDEDTVVYHKRCKAGEEISFGNWVVIAYKP